MTMPADIVNQALDAIGVMTTIGDIEEGSREAQVTLRAYGQCLRQLLRAVHWNFARRQAPMLLLGDATGQTAGVGTTVQFPWTYCYDLPADCVKARIVPLTNAAMTPAIPIMGGLSSQVPPAIGRLIPARFIVCSDYSYPPDLASVAAMSPTSRTVVNTNVKEATLIYTALMPYPETWDPLFRAAMVSYLASEVALSLIDDKRLALTIRQQQVELTKGKITQARISDGNEGVSSVDHTPDWIRGRITGSYYGSDLGNPAEGVLRYGYDNCMFSDGSTF